MGMKMKGLLWFLAAMLCVLSIPSVGIAEELVVLFEEYPPYEYSSNGEVKGINIDIIREAFRRMNIEPVFEPRPWKRALFELKHGDALALSSGFKTPQRETFAIFPSEPLSMETNVVISLLGSGLEVNSLKDLRGLRVGVIREYSYGHEFDSMAELIKVETNFNNQLLKMLLNQRMDVIIGNKLVMKYLAKEMGKLSSIKFLYEVGSEPLYMFFSRAGGEAAKNLSHDFSQAIRSMRKDGTFSGIEGLY